MGTRNRFHLGEVGFTLIELLIVVAIIGVLAAIALPKLFSAIEAAHEGVTMARLGAMRSALQLYWVDHGGGADPQNRYPWELKQIAACALHTPPHSYYDLAEDGELPDEEVGNGPQPGHQVTDWCVNGHAYHLARTVQGADKGGWNYCIPEGSFNHDANVDDPPSGVVWVDEDGEGAGGIPFNLF